MCLKPIVYIRNNNGILQEFGEIIMAKERYNVAKVILRKLLIKPLNSNRHCC